MTSFKRTLITSALPYANGPVHIGHLAGINVPEDFFARYLRLKGEEVLLIGGSDEHGVPITLKARNEGITPQDVVDKYHAMIKDSFARLGISFDPRSMLSGNTPVLKETKHWYLPLDQYEPWLREWILEQHKEWKPNVYDQCKSWIDSGLLPRAVTRDLEWGVPVPLDEAKGKVLYKWSGSRFTSWPTWNPVR